MQPPRRIILAILLPFLTFAVKNGSYAQSFPSESRLAAAEPVNPADAWSKTFDRDSSGFTLFPLGEGARMVFVSNSEGSDFYDGFLKPVRTLKKALSLVRVGYPDRILFKRGDTFEIANINSNLEIAGRGPDAPLVLGAYGNNHAPRPILLGHFYLGPHINPRFVVIQSLDFYASTRDPTAPGFKANRTSKEQRSAIAVICPGNYLWIEDCRFRYFGFAIDLEAKERNMFDTLVIRRCQVLDSWDSGHSSGIYIDNFQNILIEDNLFDHNGWTEYVRDAGKNIFNHNIYIQKSHLGEDRHIIVRGNISARASSHGCQLRPGGILENNLFLKNPLAAFVGYSQSIVRKNVVLDSDTIAGAPRGQGIELLNCGNVLAEQNIIAHKTDPKNDMSGLSFDPANAHADPFPTRGEIRFNLVYDWTGPAFYADDSADAMFVHDNFFQQNENLLVWLKTLKPQYRFRHNHYGSELNRPFQIDNQKIGLKDWRTRSGETPNDMKIDFVDPDRDIATYAKSIGLSDTTLEGFLTAARNNRRGHWDPRLTADAVNDYVRQGFYRKMP